MSETTSRIPAPPRPVKDPFPGFRFKVAIKGDGQQWLAGFTDVTGLGIETVVETFRAGGVNDFEQQLAGPTKYPARLVLKRGMADRDHLWAWYAKVCAGTIARRDVSLKLLSNDGSGTLSWTFLAACPVKWTGPDLHATTSAVAFEAIELIHRGCLPL